MDNLIHVTRTGPVCRIQLNRPDRDNALCPGMINAINRAIADDSADDPALAVVVEGGPHIFCSGADLMATRAPNSPPCDPATLYQLWQRLSEGPFVSIALVRGKVLAGGVGLAAACDLVLADDTASFALSEMLFGLHPACVLPFLMRRVGRQRAHYLALTTTTIDVDKASAWGLVDAHAEDSEALLRKHLMRIVRLKPASIQAYKRYRGQLDDLVAQAAELAIAANRHMFGDAENQAALRRYLEENRFPWE